jgi:hypothetical protein
MTSQGASEPKRIANRATNGRTAAPVLCMNHRSKRPTFLPLALLSVAIAAGCHAAKTPTVTPLASVAKPNVAEMPPSQLERANTCVSAARACAAQILANNDDGVVDCMPEDVVKLLGGHQALVNVVRNGTADMARDGVYFDKCMIEPPTGMTQQGTQTYAILRQEVTLRVPNGHLHQRGFLLAISADEGQTWRFIDGAGLNPGTTAKLLPDLPPSITLPKLELPVFVESAK